VIANALLAATAVMLALVFWLMQACAFLIPYRAALIHDYGVIVAAAAAILYANLFAAFYGLGRRLSLSDTGEKLAHVEKQLRSGGSVSAELGRLLEESDRATGT
jgi:hypothetical protein